MRARKFKARNVKRAKQLYSGAGTDGEDEFLILMDKSGVGFEIDGKQLDQINAFLVAQNAAEILWPDGSDRISRNDFIGIKEALSTATAEDFDEMTLGDIRSLIGFTELWFSES